MSILFEPGKLEEIRTLLALGKKIEAIKKYRELTGVGLAEAKAAVETIERGQSINLSAHAMPVVSIESDLALEEHIRHLLAARQKIEAVRLYRERYNCGLKDAKDAVDAIEDQMRVGRISGMPPMDTTNLDPFAPQPDRNARVLVILLALLMLGLGGLAFFFFLR